MSNVPFSPVTTIQVQVRAASAIVRLAPFLHRPSDRPPIHPYTPYLDNQYTQSRHRCMLREGIGLSTNGLVPAFERLPSSLTS